MSAIQAPALVLVTGGTGFLGAAVVLRLLQDGFSVRAAIRSESKLSLFNNRFQEEIDTGKLTFSVVPDMTVSGAFHEAVKGVDAIVHSASPLIPTDLTVHPNELIKPAVDITLRVLEDAATALSVKRIVVTSSAVTLLEPHEGKHIYTEVDWFDSAPKIVEQAGASAPGFLKYMASEVLAERAAWAWVKEYNPSYELVTVLPPWIFGKDIFSNPDTIRPGSSNFHLLSAISKANSGALTEQEYLATSESVDLLDAAEAHVRALTTPAAAGERIAIKSALLTCQDVFDVANSGAISGVVAPVGNPGAGKRFIPDRYLLAEKAERILGMTYRNPDDTISDAIRSGLELGWKP